MDREITARVRITIKDGNLNIKTKNVFNFFEEVQIISETIIAIAEDSERIESYEQNYFDGEDPSICIAFNLDDGSIQISINDIPKRSEIGVLELAKKIVLEDLAG